ncbi:hypothetical protein EW145_g6235 [Phellinidium pouzarii]|uniref:HCP-like protein n=1 Tax=Phellinidium pouzarii TaxID=167371 RepID=A0A4S4KX88_9AGAM|nr:hypothetical protein EW145_g6235 [Phellinidium pouzarii]
MAFNLSAPPVPPRPYSASAHREGSLPPPIPPLPPDFRPDIGDVQLPHLVDPLVAPRPQRLNPDLPTDMARSLDDQVAYNGVRHATPQPPPSVNYTPGGFMIPGGAQQFISPPPPPGAGFPSLPTSNIMSNDTLSASMATMSMDGGYWKNQTAYNPASPNPNPQMIRTANSSEQPGFDAYNTPSPLPPTAPLSLVSTLQSALPSVQSMTADISSKVSWIRDVFLLVTRANAATKGSNVASGSSAGTDLPTGPANITDPSLQRLADIAVPLLLTIMPSAPAPGQKLSPPAAEALYMRASLTAAGSFPHAPRTEPTRSVFANLRLRRVQDITPRGLGSDGITRHSVMPRTLESVSSADLKLEMRVMAIPLLHRAATIASVAVPQPAYVYALLLLDDFKLLATPIPPTVFMACIPSSSTMALEARRHLERAAYLHFVPAQYKLGHAYEFAESPFPFDPLLSVQYYSLASQQGEAEADMALSKWFLCGAEDIPEGGFAKDEALAYTFAEKAARKGLPSAEFAMGYYWEVGIGTPKDVQKAMEWYEKASAHGSNDAKQRITALSQSVAQALSRKEHNTLAENNLVRKRTQAKARSDAVGGTRPSGFGRANATQVVDVIRQNSVAQGMGADQQHQTLSQASVQPLAIHTSRHQHVPPTSTISLQQQQQLSQRQSQMQQYPQQRPQQQQQQPAAMPPPNGAASTRLPDRPRYSLSDGGAISSPTPSSGSPRLQPTRPGRNGARITSGTGAQTPPRTYDSPKPDGGPLPTPASPPPNSGTGTKYNTFADMGIQGQKVEEKECVIM